MFYGYGYSIFVIAWSNVIRRCFDRFLRISHGYAESGIFYHAEVIVTVPHGYHFFAGDTCFFQQYGERAGFVYA